MSDSISFSLSSVEARVTALESSVAALQAQIAAINSNVGSINSNLGSVQGYASPSLSKINQSTPADLRVTGLPWAHTNPPGLPGYSNLFYSTGSPNIIGELSSHFVFLEYGSGGTGNITRVDVILPEGFVATRFDIVNGNYKCPIDRFGKDPAEKKRNCPLISQNISSTSPILFYDFIKERGRPWVIDQILYQAQFDIQIKRVAESRTKSNEVLTVKFTVENAKKSVYTYTSPAINYNVNWKPLLV